MTKKPYNPRTIREGINAVLDNNKDTRFTRKELTRLVGIELKREVNDSAVSREIADMIGMQIINGGKVKTARTKVITVDSYMHPNARPDVLGEPEVHP